MTDGILFSGKTVEDAVAEGLRSLRLAQEQVEIEVINRGSRGLFGIGSEPAQVRITPRRARPAPAPSQPAATADAPPAQAVETATAETQAAVSTAAAETQTAVTIAADEAATAVPGEAAPVAAATDAAPAYSGDSGDDEADDDDDGDDDMVSDDEMVALAVELLSETVQRMGFDAEVVASWQEPDADNDEPYLLLNLHGRDLGALIGRRGETLGNLQYLLRLMVNQRLHQWKNIVVDVEQYRQHRTEHLMQLALRSADQVAKTGRPLALEPMPPNERRIVHLALRDHAQVYTESSGDGERRKIQILPKRS